MTIDAILKLIDMEVMQCLCFNVVTFGIESKFES